MEAPDEQVRYVLSFLGPILANTVNELETRGYKGWAGFLGTVYMTIDDVMNPEKGSEGS